MAHIKERPTKKGTRFDVCWETAGKHRSHTVKTREEALLALIAVERGDEPTKLLPDATTLGGFWGEWQERWKLGKRPKSITAVGQSRRHLEPLASVRLPQLTVAMVEDRITEIAADSPRAAQLALTHLRMVLKSAQARGHTVDPRLFAFRAPRYESKEIRFLTWDEVGLLSSHLEEHVRRIVLVAALTGMRKGELYGLTVDRVDLTEGSITLRQTKTKKPRKVWLSDRCKIILREQLLVRKPSQKNYVFSTEEGHQLGSRFEQSYRDAVKLAGLHGANFHSLRHTAIALMIRARMGPLEVAEQVGHLRGGKPDPTMIWKVYGWLFEGATKEAVKRVDDVLEATA